MKKVIALILSAVLLATMCFALASCQNTDTTDDGTFGTEGTKDLAKNGTSTTVASEVAEGTNVEKFKIGLVMVGDESEGYTEAHMTGIREALKKLGIDEATQVIWKVKIEEKEVCYDTIKELLAAGCNLIISNSYGHQDYMKRAAKEHPEVQFVATTGDTAAAAGLDNFCNAFTSVYESRYVAGVIAGLKLKELVNAGKVQDSNKDKDGNIKIGYVGAFNYAEVVSGYTAFYLGMKSIVSNIVMDVQYTNSWFDWSKEYTTAKALMDNGCIIIGQHADSTGAPTAVQEYLKNGKTVYSVGYNVDMLGVAPDAALTSAANNWEVYYEYAFKTAMYGGKIATNWTGGYKEGAVSVTALGSAVAEGTQEAVEQTIAALKSGSLKVFDTSKFTVGGKTVTWAYASDTNGDFVYDANNVIADGYYHESWVQSAPSFALRIDGITELSK